MEAARKRRLYDDLLALPDHVTGEILNGQLHTHPRPSASHALVESNLQVELGGPFHRGRGGPGGWWIIVEPEIHFIRDTEICVPDLGGWKREKMVAVPETQKFLVPPDWVCEILSPSTASKDRHIKMDIYARYQVGHMWLVDPIRRVIEAYKILDSSWSLLGKWTENDKGRVAPFDAVVLDFSVLWE